MQDYERACAAMCVEGVVLHSVCFEMYVMRVDTYFIISTCISLTACMDRLGVALNEEAVCYIPPGMLVNAVELFLTKGIPHNDFSCQQNQCLFEPRCKIRTVNFHG